MEEKQIPKVSAFKFYRHSGQILKDPLPFHQNNFNRLGDTYQLSLGAGKPLVFSRDSGFAEYVLQKNQKNYRKTKIQTEDMAKYLGKGLLTSEGEHWKKQRKLIQPAFHKKQLVQLLGTIENAILEEINKITTEKPMDIFPVFNDLAFQTVVKSLFSSAMGQKEINRLQYITEAAQKMLVKELRQPYLRWWFQIGGAIKEHQKLTQEARDILGKIIEERQKSTTKEGDLLDMLLDARYDDGTPMGREQLIDEILILFTAGHETTSNALTFACELLARNPEVQQQITDEVYKAEKASDSPLDFLKSCPFTQQVIEETMRLYPPAYVIDRTNIEDDEFEGQKIPKGSSLLFFIYEIHRHKDHWDEPDKFKPARFSNSKNEHYYPFGAGPRKCIGNNFAMYEMILAISSLMKKFSIDYKAGEIKTQPLITLKPKQAILKFNLR